VRLYGGISERVVEVRKAFGDFGIHGIFFLAENEGMG